jgi:hypothetical protein
MNIKDIGSVNDKGQYHGHQEWYLPSGGLELRGNMKNSDEIGYEEWHRYEETNFYIR